ncbi:MAG: phosphatase PAP2 family protein [Bacteroidetes bacterium]|jgi:membrane-associated phospholipid phosphatase|nr:phosphatase PAP2 family protein [Bacteroidota bacterium]MBT6684726.1 phosphatase PAP2 family protein [Bacteroidota bacterium]MBT7143827.1 phosphatase PAP2 family protein [Bacteroidota bacterium]MBT7489992.1 phosphatase PAP2 family protein [Bacteroidota bacterium]
MKIVKLVERYLLLALSFDFSFYMNKLRVINQDFKIVFYFGLFLIIISTFSKNGFSQSEKLQFPNKASVNREYIWSYWHDIRDIALSPKNLTKNQWLKVGIAVGTTGLLMSVDGDIQSIVQKSKTTSLNNFSKNFVEPFGNIHLYRNYTLISLGLLYLHGSFLHNEQTKKVAILGTKAFALTGLLTHVPKFLFGRHTPGQFQTGAENPHFWSGPGFDYRSFFSGHTSVVFSVATIIASEYSNSSGTKILAYGIASLVGISRIYDNAHWASDVFLGACFGYAVGKIIYNANNWGIRLNPIVSQDFSGMKILYKI